MAMMNEMEYRTIGSALAGGYRAAVYCRLSKDDDLQGESASIANQRDMLEKYCEKQGWEVVAVYQDDGFTGLNMERPDLQRMLRAIERRQINLVITKDLSRLGRNYLQTGHLIEDFFPRNGVRYIAMNDGIDTLRDNNDIAPFKNILNEMYSKDISKKVHSSYLLKAQKGQFTGCLAPFGYRKDPEDKNHLLIDEETAPIVRLIFGYAKLHAIDPNDPEQTNRPDSRTREVQAESVAYTVCQHYGLDTSEYSFGYVAGWSSGRELAELKASLEVIRSTAHELISALDEHLAELRQQREADLSAAQETAFVLDSGNTLFIQTCDSGYDYTLYGPDHTALDGGQLDAPGLTLPDAGQEALNLLGQTAAVAEVLLGDKLAAFQEAAEKANELSAPEAEKAAATDLSAEPTVTILWSESDKLQDGEIMPLSVANRVFEELDTAQHTDREKDGYEGGWYDKTAFRIDFTLNGQPDNYEGRQDFGDGEGSLVQHIQNYHEYYAKDENWKNFVLRNKGPEAWEQDKAEREMVLTEFNHSFRLF